MARFCRKCGTEVPDGHLACQKCGGQNLVSVGGNAPSNTPAQPMPPQAPPPGPTITGGPPTGFPQPPAGTFQAPGPGYQPPPGGFQSGGYLPPKTNGLAIASLVLSLIGCTALFGLILGIVAHGQIKNSNGAQAGQGLATAGIIISSVMLGLSLLLPAAMYPVIMKGFNSAKSSLCMNNQRQLAIALQMYAQDNSETFPAGDQWAQGTFRYTDGDVPPGKPELSLYNCPLTKKVGNSKDPDFGYNANLSTMNMGDIASPTTAVLLTDCANSEHLLKSTADISTQAHYVKTKADSLAKAFFITYADGHVDTVTDTASVDLAVPKAVRSPASSSTTYEYYPSAPTYSPY